MKKSTNSIIGAATLSLGLALGVSSLSEAKPPKDVTPKLEGGKEGLASAKQHKQIDNGKPLCNQHKLSSVSGQIKHEARSAGYIKFDGVEGNCIKGESASQHKIEGNQIKMNSQDAGKGADFIKK